MKELCFDYYMQIDYSEVVSTCNFTIKCLPQDNARQKIGQLTIDIFPERQYATGVDGMGNLQIYGRNELPHVNFYYHLAGTATTGLADYEEKAPESKAMIFRHPHGLNRPGEAVRAYYAKLEESLRGNDLEKALALMEALHRDFSYCSGSTDVNTTAEQAFAQGKGVCQDFAHIFIALLHLAGIAARYVTGFIMGEGASHAWVEVLYDGKWYGLDPTANTQVYENHIKIGVGRDAADCMLNRGIMLGGGLHTQTVRVKVREIREPSN